MSEEADKWLFDIVQPWMDKTRYFGVRGFIPLIVPL
jgi:pyrimidine-specific ribonucleoside hydrolase